LAFHHLQQNIRFRRIALRNHSIRRRIHEHQLLVYGDPRAQRVHALRIDAEDRRQEAVEAARELRANAETKDIPILAATALFRDSDLKTCLEAGCNGYIVKPFTFQELQGKVRELIPSASTTYPL